MPDPIMLLLMFIGVMLMIVLFVEEANKQGIIALSFVVVSTLWFVLAHVACGSKIERTELVTIQTVQSNAGTVQLAMIDKQPFVVTKYFGQVVDESKCKVKHIEYNRMNYGMLCLVCDSSGYELVCDQ